MLLTFMFALSLLHVLKTRCISTPLQRRHPHHSSLHIHTSYPTHIEHMQAPAHLLLSTRTSSETGNANRPSVRLPSQRTRTTRAPTPRPQAFPLPTPPSIRARVPARSLSLVPTTQAARAVGVASKLHLHARRPSSRNVGAQDRLPRRRRTIARAPRLEIIVTLPPPRLGFIRSNSLHSTFLQIPHRFILCSSSRDIGPRRHHRSRQVRPKRSLLFGLLLVAHLRSPLDRRTHPLHLPCLPPPLRRTDRWTAMMHLHLAIEARS